MKNLEMSSRTFPIDSDSLMAGIIIEIFYILIWLIKSKLLLFYNNVNAINRKDGNEKYSFS
jgi:hypothetical protein